VLERKAWPAFPQNLIAMQWATLLMAAGAVGGAVAFARRFGYCGRPAALAIGLLAATSPEITFYSTITMSEMPFALLVVVALWRIESVRDRPATKLGDVVTGAVLALPFLCRSIGVAVVVAGLASLAWRRRTLALGWMLLGLVVLAGPWVLWSLTAWGEFESGRLGYYTDYGGAWSALTGKQFGSMVTTNLALLLAGTAFMTLFSVLVGLRAVGIAVVAPLLFIGAAIWWAAMRRAVQGSALASSLAAYVAIVLVWPWPPNRFLVPIAPLLFIAAASSVPAFVGASAWRHRIRMVAGVAAAVAIGANVVLLRDWNARSAARHYPVASLADPPNWMEFERLFAWVERETPRDEVVAAGLDTMVFLYTGRRAIRVFPHRPDAFFYQSARPPVGTPEELLEGLRPFGAGYVVETPLYLFLEQAPLLAVFDELRARGDFVPAHPPLDGASGFAVWRVPSVPPKP
jgi:hypothetical protein